MKLNFLKKENGMPHTKKWNKNKTWDSKGQTYMDPTQSEEIMLILNTE